MPGAGVIPIEPTIASSKFARSVMVRAMGPSTPLTVGYLPSASTHEADARAHAGNLAPYRWPADRREALLSQRVQGEIGGHARSRTAGGSADRALQTITGSRIEPNSEPRVFPTPSLPSTALAKIIARPCRMFAPTKQSRPGS